MSLGELAQRRYAEEHSGDIKELLRKVGAVVTFFGETDWERYKRY